MLKDYPVKFDGEEIFQWDKWEESSEVIENTYQTEAGTDQVDAVRYDKLSVSCQYRCHSDWIAKFKAWSKQDSIVVSLYDAESKAYADRTMRIRDFKAAPIEFSETVDDTNGVWNVSFTLGEF